MEEIINNFHQYFIDNWDKIFEIAKSYTTPISKDDPWLQETEWDDLFNKLRKDISDEQEKAPCALDNENLT